SPVPPVPQALAPREVEHDHENVSGDATTEAAPPPIARPQARRVGVKLALGAALATVLGGLLFWRPGTRVTLDANLVAVAPFDVLAPDPKLGLWHEGLVDVLSRNLDGAGPFRTVSPSVVISHWKGRADHPSARDLGGQTGAGVVVFGQLLRSGPDSVRLNAAGLDARKDRTRTEIDRTEQAERIGRLADSVGVAGMRTVTPAFAVSFLRESVL